MPGATHLILERSRKLFRSFRLLLIDDCVRECIAPSYLRYPEAMRQYQRVSWNTSEY
jgi:hypothetical protein